MAQAFFTEQVRTRSVNAAFNDFRRDYVDLDPEEVTIARRSRDFLVDQILGLPAKDSTFPWLTGERVFFGSLARRTKTRPLDDIDVMIPMVGGGGYERLDYWDPYLVRVEPGSMTSPVRFLTDAAGYINSTRVLLKFRNSLATIPHYDNAEVNKRGEAVTLKLKSYPWTFDIVPTFGVTDGIEPLAHYVIPNGSGHWKRTDPRRDAERITRINQRHNGLVIPIIRLVKYWNRRSRIPTMMPYWIETVALGVFEELASSMGILQIGICQFFVYGADKVSQRCPDPKGLGPDLDADIDQDTRSKLVAGFREAAAISVEASGYEYNDQDHPRAIAEWRKLFGPEFA